MRCLILAQPRRGQHEEVWLRYCSTGRDGHRGAVDCERRDRRDQARRLSSRLRRACRVPRTSSRLARRLASSPRRQGGGRQATPSRLLRDDTGMAPRGAIFFCETSGNESFFPSPLVGEGGASRSEATGEGYLSIDGPQPLIRRALCARHLLPQGEKGRRPPLIPPRRKTRAHAALVLWQRRDRLAVFIVELEFQRVQVGLLALAARRLRDRGDAVLV